MPKRPASTDRVQGFEKLGMFYLGRPFDLTRQKAKPGFLLYESKDLLTHAVCVGMTGSGKTGLCIGLLEEAAIDGIPAIIIDPKGDLGNLLLTFPSLAAADFRPWVNEDEAHRKGMSPDQYATAQAAAWKAGLADWNQNGDRIARLKSAADFAIYTPGSSAGLPLSVLHAFSPPPPAILQDAERLHEQISATVTGLLGLIGLSTDPIKSPPHVLLSAILHWAWNEGQTLDVASLIRHIHTPPFRELGALDLESFYPSTGHRDDPSKNRFALAKRLNHLIAAPAFQVWMQGQPLDVGQLLYGPDGKPRISILSIAHLNDAERMFVVTLLLGQTVAWMRQQTGTSSLRAILYMDELFGYLPPVANPPSKQPLLTLLKQARAFGLGVVLATQNSVDLDYKALANAGTWFLGRLQTERDVARVMEGLEGAAAGGGRQLDRQKIERALAGLRSRIFLLHNVHDEAPVLFETRWTLSYLRGPLTREEIRILMESRKGSAVRAMKPPVESTDLTPGAASRTSAPPVLTPEIRQVFLPVHAGAPPEGRLLYRPLVLGIGQVHFTESITPIDVTKDVAYVVPLSERSTSIRWDDAVELSVAQDAFVSVPEKPSAYERTPVIAHDPDNYQVWKKDFAAWLARTQQLDRWRSPALQEVSRPGEAESAFRVRLQQLARERRDEDYDRLRQKYAPRVRALQERIRRGEQAKAREAEQATQQYMQTAISIGSALLGAFLGRRTMSSSTVGRAATAARGASRSLKETKDVARAEETLEVLRKQLADVEAQFESEVAASIQKVDPLTGSLERVALRPSKGNIRVTLVALAWLPHWLTPDGVETPAYR